MITRLKLLSLLLLIPLFLSAYAHPVLPPYDPGEIYQESDEDELILPTGFELAEIDWDDLEYDEDESFEIFIPGDKGAFFKPDGSLRGFTQPNLRIE